MVWKCPPLHLPNWNNLWKWKEDMKYTINVVPEEVDELVISSLKETFERCASEIIDPAKRYDSIENLSQLYTATATLLQYYMLHPEFQSYFAMWNNRLLQEGTVNDEDKDSQTD